jgi:asparagine synthase (glutamine-hydrolysing)
MCGIAGIVGNFKSTDMETIISTMVCTLTRRGPNSGGIKRWNGAILGHRRLAIYDLSEAGNQPMVSADGEIGVVFNGSIYNYREIRQELKRYYNAVFQSNTDTEVLLHGYKTWGLDRLVARLRGMFAFGLWDDRNRKLYLVRDRVGVKPLVFTIHNGCIAFASTIRSLRTAGYVDELDATAMLEFLQRGFITDGHSIYRGVSKVPAATIMEWTDGVLKARQYWAPPSPAISPPSFQEAVEETERLLLQAVEMRLHADVPVGALLSGGIDSSLICWAITKLGGDVTAYTVATPGDPWDETADACKTAKKLGIPHRLLELSEKETPELEELISAYSEPFASPSALGMLRASCAVTTSAKVLLTGDGGDDIFLGYPRHRHLWLANHISHVLPSGMKTSWLAYRSMIPQLGPLRRAVSLMNYASGDLSAFTDGIKGFMKHYSRSWLGDRLVNAYSPSYEFTQFNGIGYETLETFLSYERQTQFVGEYMTKVDGATMHHGMEARSPFLDHYLWEYASSLPIHLRLYRGQLKAILRTLARRRVGARVARRRKTGFRIPVQRWLLGRWRQLIEETLCESLLEKEGWIRAKPALTFLQSAPKADKAPEFLWHLLVLEKWLRYERFSTAVSLQNT